MRPSMRQIAKNANVSAMTVSRVLRGCPGQASPETVERILLESRKLSYIPVRSGLQNRHQETRIISMVLEGSAPHSFFNPLNTVFYDGLSQAATRHGYDLLHLLRDESDWILNDEELRFLDRRSDGAIFITSTAGHRQKALEALVSHNIPTVVFGRRDVPDGVAWIDTDNEAVSQLAVGALVAQGHRRIAFLAGPDERYDRRQRQLAFTRAMRSHHLDEFAQAIVPAVKSDFSLDEQVALQIVERKATAVVCVTDAHALELWKFLERQGLRVPLDISLVGVDNTAEAHWRGLTTVDVNLSRAGQFALESWVALRNGANFRDCCQVLPAEYVERSSIRSLREADQNHTPKPNKQDN